MPLRLSGGGGPPGPSGAPRELKCMLICTLNRQCHSGTHGGHMGGSAPGSGVSNPPVSRPQTARPPVLGGPIGRPYGGCILGVFLIYFWKGPEGPDFRPEGPGAPPNVLRRNRRTFGRLAGAFGAGQGAKICIDEKTMKSKT